MAKKIEGMIKVINLSGSGAARTKKFTCPGDCKKLTVVVVQAQPEKLNVVVVAKP
jgi:hypothetical protein